jgi:hypothetical protein
MSAATFHSGKRVALLETSQWWLQPVSIFQRFGVLNCAQTSSAQFVDLSRGTEVPYWDKAYTDKIMALIDVLNGLA